MITLVWSYGGGTQSAAIAVLILQGKLPRPDVIVMADTSREVSETWRYLYTVVEPALVNNLGAHVAIVPHSYANWDVVKEKKGDVLIPAFTRQNGTVGKLPTFCSNEWKQRPIRRWLRDNYIDDCDVWLGISTDEMERMKPSGLNWYRHVYPLIEMLPTSRHQCVSIVEQYGWPTPPKSRCWMCPNMSSHSWRQLRDKYPDDFAKAVKLEKDIQEVDSLMYLHELAIPLEDAVDESARQTDMFDGCDSGYCWT